MEEEDIVHRSSHSEDKVNRDASPSYDRLSSPDVATAQDTLTKGDSRPVPARQTTNEDEPFKVPTSAQLLGPTSSPPLSRTVRGPQPHRLSDLIKRRVPQLPKSSPRLDPPHMSSPDTDPPDMDPP